MNRPSRILWKCLLLAIGTELAQHVEAIKARQKAQTEATARARVRSCEDLHCRVGYVRGLDAPSISSEDRHRPEAGLCFFGILQLDSLIRAALARSRVETEERQLC